MMQLSRSRWVTLLASKLDTAPKPPNKFIKSLLKVEIATTKIAVHKTINSKGKGGLVVKLESIRKGTPLCPSK